MSYKQKDLPQTVGVLDIEKGGMDSLTEFAWLTDDTISFGSWCFTDNLRIKPTNVVLHSLIDIVSKNGQLLLNVSPKADGTIPDDQRNCLLELGQWLGQYGECIYETRPFTSHGHGPTQPKAGRHGGKATDIAYTGKDVRYTAKGNKLYAIVLGVPKAGESTLLEATGNLNADQIESITLLGSDAKVQFELTGKGIAILNPESFPDQLANVFKIVVANSP